MFTAIIMVITKTYTKIVITFIVLSFDPDIRN